MTLVNDEQTCSIISLAFYTYLDPIIFLGARVPHLRYDQLPPLSDTDYAKHVTGNAFLVRHQAYLICFRRILKYHDSSIWIHFGEQKGVICSSG
jgi:hypothetical protein